MRASNQLAEHSPGHTLFCLNFVRFEKLHCVSLDMMPVFQNTSDSTTYSNFQFFPKKIFSHININIFKTCILCHCLKQSSPNNAMKNLANSFYDNKINLLNAFPFYDCIY